MLLSSSRRWTRLKLVPKRFKCSMSPSDFGCGFSISCDSVVRHRLLPFHLRKSQPRYASWTLLSPVTTNLEAPLQERLCLEERILAEPELYVPLHTAHTGHTWLLFVSALSPFLLSSQNKSYFRPVGSWNQNMLRIIGFDSQGVRNLRIERAAENVQPTMNDAKLNKFLGKQNISSYAPHSMLLKLAMLMRSPVARKLRTTDIHEPVAHALQRKRGGRAGSNRTNDTDIEINPQGDTGASSFGDDCGSNPVEATNEPAGETELLCHILSDERPLGSCIKQTVDDHLPFTVTMSKSSNDLQPSSA
ncbi:hypothetical protein T08_1514 [Trichinella sp. T8]|nr:hypothetical protein T08_1514 [Trichinella sp. T8]